MAEGSFFSNFFSVKQNHWPDGVMLCSAYAGLVCVVVAVSAAGIVCDLPDDPVADWRQVSADMADHPWIKVVLFVALGLLALALIVKTATACYDTFLDGSNEGVVLFNDA